MSLPIEIKNEVQESIVQLISINKRASADQASCPAGGTGATGGAWDNSTHRDAAIALINEMRATLIAYGMMKGSA